MEAALKRIVGYCDPLSVEPGRPVRFMVSSVDGDFDATVVRLWCGDVSPDGHGFDEEVIATGVDGRHRGFEQPIRPGSFASIEANDFLESLDSLLLEVAVWPTAPGGRRQTLVASHGATGGFELALDEQGRPLAEVGGPDARTRLVCSSSLPRRRWTTLRLSLDRASGVARLDVSTLAHGPAERAPHEQVTCRVGPDVRPGSDGPLTFAASRAVDGIVSDHFDGRIDGCALGDRVEGVARASWDFSEGIGTDRIHDRGPLRLHGRTVQLPTRAVPGIAWTGEVHDWRQAPEEYGAIHFHSDDLYDAGWQPSVTFDVPDTFPSGVYALRVTTSTSEDHIPFFVTPSPIRAAPPVAFLAPTVTYRAYANIKLTAMPDRVFGNGARRPMDNERFLLDHPEIGPGTYDHHRDGSGVVFSSHLRPVLNLRPKCGVWSFTADTNVTAWLHHTGTDHDVITDDLLHERGIEVLGRYRVIVTGTHPEYWTTPMLDALDQFLSSGGRLIYLGANGFYWRAAFHPAAPAAVEVRRAEDGTRAWIAEPGEYHHEATGELGGLWRRIGRPPNRLAGVGFAAQGFSRSGSYRWTAARRDPRVDFAVDGLSERDVLGDHGSVGGGAAGQEIDRYDVELGSPSHAVVLATSSDLPADMLVTKEELFANGIAAAPVRSDVVFFETSSGGAVFSASSIAWAASLASNGYDNDIARLTANVLRRFADPEPFDPM
jgi:N,N-dimethylformamidase